MTTENTNGFLPDGYESPKTNSLNYMKLEKGENKFRILSKPIVGWIDWKDQKPLRFRMGEKPTKPVDPKLPIKHFWAMVVWNYKLEMIQILELTQATIRGAIENMAKDSDWGNPYLYDLKIIKTGEGMETEYAVNPVPHKVLIQEAKDAYMAKGIIQLDALYDGGDPFEHSTPAVVVAQPKAAVLTNDDLPF